MVRIITDSAADFEPEEMEQMHVTCIPLTVMFGTKEYQENVDLNKNQFYDLLRDSGEFPKTAQASPQLLKDLFRQADAAGDEAIYITISSGFSGTYQNAELLRQKLNLPGCYVVDSENGTGGQRMVVEYAVKLRDEGKTAKEIVSALEAMRKRVVLYACMDTLEYLYKGGRISGAVYRVGSLAQIKPILQVDAEGKLAIPAKAMGMKKGMAFMCEKVKELPPDGEFPFYVMYTDDRVNGLALAERIRALGIEVPEERIINVGAAIGTHVGPKACGLVYVH
ncbi:MAG: DegV family protein [Clostridia bacterium]|nr:DegV family protein [Clostridia bacterium]